MKWSPCLMLLAGMIVISGCQKPPVADNISVVAGPMPGWSAHREVEIWVQVQGVGIPKLVYWPVGKDADRRAALLHSRTPEPSGETAVLRFRPSLLNPGTRYAYRLEGVERSEEGHFQSQADWPYRTDAPDFSFIFGSCLYLNDEPYDRPGKPYGQGGEILSHMASSGADFMLWVGDNSYLRPADWTSPAGMRYRWARDKADPSLQALWRSMHHLATWDDHDFGPNDSSKSFPLRRDSQSLFREFWANPPSGLPEDEGIMSSFVWSDCLFVLLDNRSNRDANHLDLQAHPDKTMLGKRQLEWLEQTLLEHRAAPFKFIVQGGQILKDHTFESYAQFPADRKRVMDFIQKQKMEGVFFLSGDRHFTELNLLPRKGAYPLYELTSSPIGSGVAASAIKLETDNPLRVPGTLVDTQNFCRISVVGPKGERVARLSSVDKTGVERWKLEISAKELRSP
jgi:alkaline phosphatase D